LRNSLFQTSEYSIFSGSGTTFRFTLAKTSADAITLESQFTEQYILAQMSTHSSAKKVQFNKFSSLPLELRLIIWKFAKLEGQIISLTILVKEDFSNNYLFNPFGPIVGSDWFHRKIEGTGRPWYGSYRSPALLRVNREARKVTLESYKLIFQNGNFVYPIYIDPSKDTIQSQRISDYSAIANSNWGPDDREDFKKIKFVSLSEKITRWLVYRGHGFELLNLFEGIDVIDLLCDGEPWGEDVESEESETMEEEIVSVLPRLWENLRRETRARETQLKEATSPNNGEIKDTVGQPEEQPVELPLVRFLEPEQMKEYGMPAYEETEEDFYGRDWSD
jgi:hypothetical protein